MGENTLELAQGKTQGLYSAALELAGLRFEQLCSRATPGQWRLHTRDGAWMGQIAEHVALANERILERLHTLSWSEGHAPDVSDDEIPYLFYRMDDPPQLAVPSGSWTTWTEHALRFRASLNAIGQWAFDAGPDLRRRGAAHPAFGWLDGAQWLLFAGAHVERHRSQLIGMIGHAPQRV